MPTSRGLHLKADYQDEGLIPGFFSWMEALGKPIDTVEALAMGRQTRIVGIAEDGWIIRKPCKAIDITVELVDGSAFCKSFTFQELNEVTQQ